MSAAADVMTGRAWVFGDDILNDGGITTLEMTRQGVFDPALLARSCMAGVDPGFAARAAAGDILVAGRSFGRGQLHVQGPLAIKGLGVGLVCVSMTRSFFRLSVAAGVPMLPYVSGLEDAVSDGDRLEVDFRQGRIRNLSRGTCLAADPLPDFLWQFIAAGGERAWLAQRNA